MNPSGAHAMIGLRAPIYSYTFPGEPRSSPTIIQRTSEATSSRVHSVCGRYPERCHRILEPQLVDELHVLIAEVSDEHRLDPATEFRPVLEELLQRTEEVIRFPVLPEDAGVRDAHRRALRGCADPGNAAARVKSSGSYPCERISTSL